MIQSWAEMVVSPAITNSPLMSGNHCTRAANGQDSGDRSFSLPSATEKPTDFTATGYRSHGGSNDFSVR